MKQKHIFIVAAVLLLVAFVTGSYFYKKQQTEQAAQLAAKNQVALVRPDAPSFGNADAPVHIVEFFDPACETCRDFYPMVKALMAEHPGKIRLTLRYAPFHQGSEAVVKALEASRKQGKFEPSLETLFASQNVWVQNHVAHAELIGPLLAPLGIDMGRLQNDANAPEVAAIIARDLLDAKTMNVTKTPEYFVNGKPLPSFGFDQLRSLVGDALLASNSK
ncbi:MAG: DsbA family protein [Gammaproteobacteria bacterium]|uniref:DsbA family protein n=1 Tax=Rhodoferax sp. TaxID=50421 RepID=UPI0018548094|nr:thioredoxin domain-containing protein [Rhodoferax sp.]MBU3898377.1 DsbA family protein [Gammaproteobacteria bacterium]MBA3059358.1 disulfide bond formation protein DsbA [Rhodoferax sp.]MBU3998096.1 DsbA family protein [Gammaproteobacteria bacterium]MBU4079151.1 DsbA family protein [Gammaproteobacteria bacterium]MBU4113784.1 DsbA family protein [Gammaproteobacteria bacterium]